jgi:hypothetical protein
MTPGENLLGIQPAKALKVRYWNGEDPAEEILRRIEATCLHFGVDPELVEGRLFVDSGRDSEIIVANQARSGFVIATPVVDALTEALKNDAFDVLIIDPFVSAHRVGENDNMAIDAVAKSFGRIASTANCAIEIVHHVRKTGGAEVTAEDGCGRARMSPLHDRSASSTACRKRKPNKLALTRNGASTSGAISTKPTLRHRAERRHGFGSPMSPSATGAAARSMTKTMLASPSSGNGQTPSQASRSQTSAPSKPASPPAAGEKARRPRTGRAMPSPTS